MQSIMDKEFNTDGYIIPITGYSLGPFLSNLANSLSDDGNPMKIVPSDTYCAKHIGKYLSKDQIVFDHLSNSTEYKFEYLLDFYDIDSPRRMVFPQMNYDYSYPKMCRGLKFITQTSPEYKPYFSNLHSLLNTFHKLYINDFYYTPIHNQKGSLHSLVLNQVAEKHGIRSIRYSFSPLSGRRSARNAIDMEFPELQDALESPLSNAEEEQAKQYLNSIRNNKPEFGSKTNLTPKYTTKLRDKLQKVLLFKSESINRISRIMYRSLLTRASRKYQSKYYLSKKNANDLIENIDYVFFPLQYYRESRMTLRSAPFYDQAWLIEYLSRNIPRTTQLVVKDHPRQVGSLPNKTAREISQFSNFVPASMSAHKIIRNASAVVTLNNTVGHEALLWGKPVVTLGDALYSGTKLTSDVHDIDNLDAKISAAIDEGGPTEEEILRYITGLYKVSDPVVWGDSDDENISNVVKSIYRRNPN